MNEAMDFTLLQGTIANDLGFDNSYLTVEGLAPASPQGIDAVFVPTLGRRQNLASLLTVMRAASPQVFVVLSESFDKVPMIPGVQSLVVTKSKHLEFLSSIRSSVNPSVIFKQDYDLPTKRNLAIHYARQKGYRYMALIDDDIVLTPAHVQRAVALLKTGAGLVGYYSLQFPDKSVIDLLECNLLEQSPAVSLSGNCLFMDLEKVRGFFPYVYNEDWLFLITNLRQKIMGAGTVRQCYHEPWLNFQRIRFEQFGDVIAAGAKHYKENCANGLPIDRSFWEETYAGYAERLARLREAAYAKRRFEVQLDTAMSALKGFDARDIIHFIDHFQNETKQKTYEAIFHHQ